MGRISKTRLLNADGTIADTVVNATANVWTRSFELAAGSSFCVSMRAKGTNPDIDIYLEQTHLNPDETTEGNANATGQGVVGDVYNGWVQPAGSSKLADITDNAWHHFVISPVALPYLRLLIDGQGSNPADCAVETYISQKEDRA